MALVACEECGREISDKAPFCPGCGLPGVNNRSISHDYSADTDTKYNDTKGVSRLQYVSRLSGDTVIVKRGWCWPAFFFTWMWAGYKRLWSKFIISLGFSFVVSIIMTNIIAPIITASVVNTSLVSKLTFGYRELNQNNYHEIFSYVWYVYIFAYFVLSLPIYVWFGLRGNEWVRDGLIEKGYSEVLGGNADVCAEKEHKSISTKQLLCVIFKRYIPLLLVFVVIVCGTNAVYRNVILVRYPLAVEYVKYDIIGRLSQSVDQRSYVDMLSGTLIRNLSRHGVNDHDINTKVSDLVKEYDIEKSIRLGKYNIYGDKISFISNLGQNIVVDQYYFIITDNQSRAMYTFDRPILKRNGFFLVDNDAKLESISFIGGFDKKYERDNHLIFLNIVKEFNKLNYKKRFPGDQAGTIRVQYTENKDDMQSIAQVMYEDNSYVFNTPAISYSIDIN